MLAVEVREPGCIGLRSDVPIPVAGPGQALVRVRATTLCATDRKIVDGRFPGVRYPHIPGHEWAGEVVEVGQGVSGITPGTRVGVEVHVGCGRCAPCLEGRYNLCENYGRRELGHAHIGFTVPGGLAEYAAVPVKALHPLPEGVTFEEGAFTDNVGVALWAVERAAIPPGARVLVIGPGAIGLLALQIAKGSAGRLVLAGTRADRLEVGRALGAEAVVNVREVPDPVTAVRDALGGPADVVVEFAGTPDAAQLALSASRRGGRVVLGGSTGLGSVLPLELATVVRGELEVLGSLANPKGVSRRGLSLIASRRVDVQPLITHRMPLSAFSEAWDTFFSRRGGAIRVMLDPQGGTVA